MYQNVHSFRKLTAHTWGLKWKLSTVTFHDVTLMILNLTLSERRLLCLICLTRQVQSLGVQERNYWDRERLFTMTYLNVLTLTKKTTHTAVELSNSFINSSRGPHHRIRSIQNDQQAIRHSSVIFVAPYWQYRISCLKVQLASLAQGADSEKRNIGLDIM